MSKPRRYLKVWKEVNGLGGWEYQPLLIVRWVRMSPNKPTVRYIFREDGTGGAHLR